MNRRAGKEFFLVSEMPNTQIVHLSGIHGFMLVITMSWLHMTGFLLLEHIRQ
jgi:hypothetical protein